jgi:hypothetical protein
MGVAAKAAAPLTWPDVSLPQHTAAPVASATPQACDAPEASVESGVPNGAASWPVLLSPKQSGAPEWKASAQAKAAPAARLGPANGPASETKLAFEKSTAAAGEAAACACAEASTAATPPKQIRDEFEAMTAHVKASAEATETKAPLGANKSAALLL